MTNNDFSSLHPIVEPPPAPSLRDLSLLFLRLGATSFGGPAAHIALMQREFVERRKWITGERFADMLGVVNLIPGPNSTELAIHIGSELAGTRGLFVAGFCFITPAFAIVLLLAWMYGEYGTTPNATAILTGIKPVVLAVIAHALWKLAGGMIKKRVMAALAVIVLIAGILGAPELALLLGSGVAGAVFAKLGTHRKFASKAGENLQDDNGKNQQSAMGDAEGDRRANRKSNAPFLVVPGILSGIFVAPTIGTIFLYFLYIGSVLYGSGYVLLAFLRDDLVNTLQWLTERQLLDAISIGQITPGPVFTTATFIGYILGGFPGGIAATVGIFLPSFLFVLLSRGWIAKFRSNSTAAGFLDGVNAGAFALIAVALIFLAEGTLISPVYWGLAVASLLLLILTKINPTWLIVAGGVVGILDYGMY